MSDVVNPMSISLHTNSATVSNPGFSDVLSCVHRFILDCAMAPPDIPPLQDKQILRTWQSLAPLPDAAEYCLITLIGTIRHGTTVIDYAPQIDPRIESYLTNQSQTLNDDYSERGSRHLRQLYEYTVQVDFFGVDTVAPQTYERARLCHLLACSSEASAIFHDYNPRLSCLYADDISSFGELDDGHLIRQRYSLTLHLCEEVEHRLPQRFIKDIDLQLDNVSSQTTQQATRIIYGNSRK